jgi:hypothetical protein
MAATSHSLKRELEELVLEQIHALKQQATMNDRDPRVSPAALPDHGDFLASGSRFANVRAFETRPVRVDMLIAAG